MVEHLQLIYINSLYIVFASIVQKHHYVFTVRSPVIKSEKQTLITSQYL